MGNFESDKKANKYDRVIIGDCLFQTNENQFKGKAGVKMSECE